MTEIKVTLAIFGDVFEKKFISEIVDIPPTSFWKKGDIIPNTKMSLARTETCWEYSYKLETLSLEEISDYLYMRFSRNLDQLAIFVIKNNLEVKIDIVVEIVDDEKPSLFFNKLFLQLVSKLNAEVDLDLYTL